VRVVLKRNSLLILVLATVLLCGGALKSREEYLQTIPVHERYQCALCHASRLPTSASDLNKFGIDFKDNDYVWDGVLAALDSDADGFANGIEIGDESGDGIADIAFERSNPGDPLNTPNSIPKSTWGILKSLFEH
jgi:hypothetical protein